MTSRILRITMLFTILALQNGLAQNPYSYLENTSAKFYSPEKVKVGTKIKFEVDPFKNPLLLKKQPESIILHISTDYLESFEKISMIPGNDGFWRTEYTLKDTSARSILFGFQTGPKRFYNNASAYYEIIVFEGRKPRQGAYMGSAVSAADMGGSRRSSLGYALRQINKELEYYPDNYSARLTQITLLLKSDQMTSNRKRRFEIELEEELKKKSDDADFLRYAMRAYRQLDKNEEAEKVHRLLVKLDPDGEQAVQLKLAGVLNEPDAQTRAVRLEQLLREHPDTGLTETLLSQLTTAVIESLDSLKMTSVGDRLMENAQTPQGASALAAIAGWLADHHAHSGRAVTYAQQAIEILENVDIESRPPEISEKEWSNRITQTRARYLGILGWSQILNRDIEEGIATLEVAAKDLFEPKLYFHLAEGYQRLGNRADALLNYARAAAFGGEFAQTAYDAFSLIWDSSSGTLEQKNTFLRREEMWIARQHQYRIIDDKLERPAPDFQLEDLDGGLVRLSDQRGTVILLTFWATWSRSSVQALREIQSLTNQFGTDILFLTVAMDPNVDSVYRFLDDTGLILPVLFNDGIEKKYGLTGVPVTYVIDANGMIQYEHKGYRPDLTQVLRVEINDLLGKIE